MTTSALLASDLNTPQGLKTFANRGCAEVTKFGIARVAALQAADGVAFGNSKFGQDGGPHSPEPR